MNKEPWSGCYSLSKARSALTLIEVVAALALLASLLVAILAAHDRHAKQLLKAELRLLAIDAADQLLSEWALAKPMVIPAEEGTTTGNVPFRWTVSSRSDPAITELGLQIARLEVFAVQELSGEQATEQPLSAVEFLTSSALHGGP